MGKQKFRNILLLLLLPISFLVLTLAPPLAEATKTIVNKSERKQKITSPVFVRTHKVRSGDTLYSILRSFNFNQNQLSQVFNKTVLPKDYDLMIGEKFRITTNKSEQLTQIEFFDRDQDIVYKYWRKGQRAAGAQKEARSYLVKVKKYSGQVKGSLIGSIKKVVPDKLVPYRFMDAYVWDQKLRQGLERGSHFALTIEEKYENEEFVKYGEILATELEINGEVIRRYFVPFKGGGSFIDPERSQNDRPLFSPVDYAHISSKFQRSRFHPIKKRRIAHLGVDFALPAGEEIYAVYGGRVVKSGNNRASGRYVAIQHPNGMTSFYNHMNSIEKHIRPGLYVSAGELIGKIGCSGYCTKPHLHFAIKQGGRFIDPLPLLRSYPFRSRKHIYVHLAQLKKEQQPSQ